MDKSKIDCLEDVDQSVDHGNDRVEVTDVDVRTR
jgi:hypothetical protein